MIKKILLILLAIAAVYGAVLSPFSLTETLAKKERFETAIVDRQTAQQSRDSARTNLSNSKNAFESQRSFDIHYSDLYKIKELIDNVSGVSYYGLSEVDPNNNYAVGAVLNIDDYVDLNTPRPAAVKMSLIAENTAAGLRVVNTLALPTVSIAVLEPGQIDVIFLTGGES